MPAKDAKTAVHKFARFRLPLRPSWRVARISGKIPGAGGEERVNIWLDLDVLTEEALSGGEPLTALNQELIIQATTNVAG